MTDTTEALRAAREAERARDWVAARDRFAAAAAEHPLGPDDLASLANCAWWLGDLDAALPALQEAHRRFLEEGEPGRAALIALDVGYTLALRGDEAQASGWTSRAVTLLQDLPERAEHGYLEYILGFETAFAASDPGAALASADRVHDLGRRHSDPTLRALGVLARGRVLVQQGDVGRGMPLLDEAMVAAVSDELDPGWAGNIYCHLMEACHEIADLRRAGEWTAVTARWCERMPGAGPFMGICRVHRAQVLQARGAWQQAEREALAVCEGGTTFGAGIVAEAYYQLGDIRRQRGDARGAESAFKEAHRRGRDPQPGLALLRLSTGKVDVATAALRSALSVAGGDALARARLLPAAVEIAVAAGDLEQARETAGELARTAATYGTTAFGAQSLHAQGTVLLAADQAEPALRPLRKALRLWQELGAPYEVARVRLLLGRAYDALGDREAAALERDAAHAEFTRIGAAWSVATTPPRRRTPGGLTRRESEVLAMVAAGKSNQQIAGELVLSLRTVERHLATIYDKLGVHGRSARAAAVSHALREGLLA